MKIFWSWQSDTPWKTGRYFVRDALLAAIKILKQPEEVEEPTTAENRESMHLDQDRQNVTGNPALADTIKRKIRDSAVFVGDVTPVSRIPKRKGIKNSREKRNMNPNVAIELGYAQHAVGDERVLMVLNEHYGGREFLPFDLQHHAGPIIYSLKPDATKAEITLEHANLRSQFVAALRGFLDAPTAATAPPFPSVPATSTPVVWFKPGEVLAKFDHNTEYGFVDDRGLYLKISPRSAVGRPFTTGELYEMQRQVQPGLLHRQQTGIAGYNSRGAILLEPVSGSGGRLRAATQMFHNGELWAIGRELLVDNNFGKFIPVRLLETAYREALIRSVDFMQRKLGIPPPYTVEFGAAGVSGYSLAIDSNPDNPYQIREDVFSEGFVLTDTSRVAIDTALLRVYEAFFQRTGYPRPSNLFGPPPPTGRQPS
jgi:hypothetical protein